eukprot:jgi/Chlat1/2568/Chrsp175S02413
MEGELLVDGTAYLARLREVERIRRDQDAVHRKINKLHSKLAVTPPEKAQTFGDKLWIRLREFYIEAQDLGRALERTAASCAAELEALLPPGSVPVRSGDNTKRKKPRTEGERRDHVKDPPRTVRPGEQVAARISGDGAEKHDWILVTVVGLNPHTRRYEVVDEEPAEEGGEPKRYALPSSAIIALPKCPDPTGRPEFPRGSKVLAVYPGTTTLYRATCISPPSKRKTSDYLLEFDDDEEEGVEGVPQRPTPFKHVVALPAGYRQ